MRAPEALRCRSQAAVSDTSCSRAAMRRSRHWLRSTPISISTMFSQLACLGTWWNSNRRSTRRASQDDPDALGLGKVNVGELAHADGEVLCRVAIGDLDLAPGLVGLE